MNDQGLLYIFIEPDTTTNAYYKDMATRINGYKISCDLLREIEIALLIYEPHDFRKRVIELIKLAGVW